MALRINSEAPNFTAETTQGKINFPSSVVHTGVKSFGWEKRMAHPLPTHSWKLILP